MKKLPAIIHDHLRMMREFYDTVPAGSGWLRSAYIRLLARYYRHIIPASASVLEIGCGSGDLLACLPNRDVTGVDLSAVQVKRASERIPHGRFYQQSGELLNLDRTFDCIVISETLNLAADVQEVFRSICSVAHPRTRLVVNCYNSLWRPLFSLATAFGIRSRVPHFNWLGPEDVRNMMELAEWQLVTAEPRILMPVPLLWIDRFLNRWVAPLLPPLCLTLFQVARPRKVVAANEPSVSVIVPARNEAGNIEAAVTRCPALGRSVEMIFVEGHSKDDTWAEIQRVMGKYPDRQISAVKQSGVGKGNAVRDGFAKASGDILMILDADLTVAPEELYKFYEVLVSGHAELANGVRLVYPMEGEAMRFLNLLGNKFFSSAFTWLLGEPIKDTLCGTKALWRTDYDSIASNRSYFGDFDPFGDYDLIFGAAKLNLKIVDVPIRYRKRTYGTTQIHRWKHGWLLLRMVFFAAKRIKFV